MTNSNTSTADATRGEQPVPAADDKQAPPNSLPSWQDCSRIIGNAEFRKRAAEGLEGSVLDTPPTTPEPTALHRFIYEYDDADPYRSAWFLHRLELVIKECAALSAPAPAGDAPPGFKLVPVTPTEEMLTRALYANERGDIQIREARAIYAAMLDAAPAVPGDAPKGEEHPGAVMISRAYTTTMEVLGMHLKRETCEGKPIGHICPNAGDACRYPACAVHHPCEQPCSAATVEGEPAQAVPTDELAAAAFKAALNDDRPWGDVPNSTQALWRRAVTAVLSAFPAQAVPAGLPQPVGVRYRIRGTDFSWRYADHPELVERIKATMDDDGAQPFYEVCPLYASPPAGTAAPTDALAALQELVESHRALFLAKPEPTPDDILIDRKHRYDTAWANARAILAQGNQEGSQP